MPRDLVYAAMTDLYSDGLKMRQPGNKKTKKKGTLDFAGPNWVMLLDAHDKLMGFQDFQLLSTVLSILQVENSGSKCG